MSPSWGNARADLVHRETSDCPETRLLKLHGTGRCPDPAAIHFLRFPSHSEEQRGVMARLSCIQSCHFLNVLDPQNIHFKGKTSQMTNGVKNTTRPEESAEVLAENPGRKGVAAAVPPRSSPCKTSLTTTVSAPHSAARNPGSGQPHIEERRSRSPPLTQAAPRPWAVRPRLTTPIRPEKAPQERPPALSALGPAPPNPCPRQPMTARERRCVAYLVGDFLTRSGGGLWGVAHEDDLRRPCSPLARQRGVRE